MIKIPYLIILKYSPVGLKIQTTSGSVVPVSRIELTTVASNSRFNTTRSVPGHTIEAPNTLTYKRSSWTRSTGPSRTIRSIPGHNHRDPKHSNTPIGRMPELDTLYRPQTDFEKSRKHRKIPQTDPAKVPETPCRPTDG